MSYSKKFINDLLNDYNKYMRCKTIYTYEYKYILKSGLSIQN